MTQPTAGGLGGLGGFINSPAGGNMLQAVGMSLMSSPRNAPLANFGKLYTGLQDQQMKLDERDQSRASLAAVLKAAGFNDEQAAILSADPNAVRAALEQKKLQDEKAADDSFYARRPVFGGFGGLGGQPDATQPAAGGLLSFPGVSDAQAPEIERTPLPAPTQTQFGLRGAAQLDPHNLNVGQTPPDDRVLEPVVNIPQTAQIAQFPIPSGVVQGKSPPGLPATAQHGAVMRGGDGKTYQYIQLSGGPGGDGEWGWGEVNLNGPEGQGPGQPSGNKTLDWLNKNDPEAAKLVDQGFSIRDAFEIAQVRQRSMNGVPQDQAPGQTSGNRTLGYLKKHAPDVAALTEGPGGISVRDAYSIHMEDRKLRQAADETQAKLDQLYRYRDQYTQWASTARSDKTYNVAKRGLDDIDSQIARLERQQTRLAPPDGFRALEMRAEAAGLQPGTPEYQKFMASGGREGSLVTINNSPEGDVFAGMPKDIREEMFKRQGEAQDAADLIGITNQGLQLLDQGAITGAGSGAKVAAVKWAQSLGVPIDGDIADAVNNAETYRAVMAQAVGKVIKNFGSGTGLSDADRQYAERLAGGDTTLNEPAIRRILAAGVKSAKSKIGNFNSMRDKVLSGDLSAILNVQEPPEYSAPAAGGGTRARNPQTGETLEWDGSQWRPVQ